eukprot:TRINITY_DN868_c0_g1_i1.p1 TRINITY_DN868_c0_g1~~TRINITY_DN868_c0_g1_i1.p1  ORF type:complete len:238 (-),score=47.19 TRINITY_DN868_c0_g1_i1:95-718(-)
MTDNAYQYRSSQEDLTVTAPEPFHKRPVVKHGIFYLFHFINFVLLCVAATSNTVWTKLTLTVNGTTTTSSLSLATVTSGTTSAAWADVDKLGTAGTNNAKIAQAAQGLVVVSILLQLGHAAVYAFFYIRKKLDNVITRMINFGFVFVKFLFLVIAVGVYNNSSNTFISTVKANGGTSKLSVGSNCIVAVIILDLITFGVFCVFNRGH